MSAKERTKGHNWERMVARMIGDKMRGAEVRRGLQYADGGGCADVICPVFWPECKVGKRPNIVKALEQAKDNARDGMMAVAIVKKDYELATVTMYLGDWLELVEQWWLTAGR